MKKTSSHNYYEFLLCSLLCGAPPVAAIFGGKETDPERYPYAVSLQGRTDVPFCGGSLVAPDVVLSAGHCARGRRNWLGMRRANYKAIFGRRTLDERDEGGEYGVRREVPHPRFRVGGDGGNVEISPGVEGFEMDYDFMLVFLKESVSSDDAAFVNLNSNTSVPEERAGLTVMGWGDTAIGNGEVPSNTLMEVEGYVVSNRECSSRKSGRVTYEGAITNNELCADEYDGYENYENYGGTCNGDSGGPLIVRGDSPEGDVQVGIVSWGPCGTSHKLPVVYARVSSQYEWIRDEVCRGSVDPPSSFDCPRREMGVGGIRLAGGSAVVVLATAVVLLKVRRRQVSLREDASSDDTDHAKSSNFLLV